MEKVFHHIETKQAAVFPADADIADFPEYQENPSERIITEAEIRFYRDLALATSDWMAVQDRTMTQAEIDYRQALRDLPTTADFVAGSFAGMFMPPPPAKS